MTFRQLFCRETCTYTYLLGDAGQAVLIDSVDTHADRDAGLVRDLGLDLVAAIETHVHADHITGAWRLRGHFPNLKTVALRRCCNGADVCLDDRGVYRFGGIALEARATPGHTSGCCSWVDHANGRAFTGDALLIRGCGRTDFQDGDAALLYESVWQNILSLPESTLLYPGHDYHGRTVTTVAEERAHNPRLGGGRDVATFTRIMSELRLDPPARIAVAVPANLRGGSPT